MKPIKIPTYHFGGEYQQILTIRDDNMDPDSVIVLQDDTKGERPHRIYLTIDEAIILGKSLIEYAEKKK